MGDSQESAKAPGLDWMYKGPAALVNREDYLLGRSVDKSLKILEETEKGNAFSYAEEVEKDLTPASIFASRGRAGPVDVIRKIKEDPLYQIQKKEEESLKQLLKNPVRMKQLQLLAEQRLKESSGSSSKKKKKKSKRKHNSSNSSDSDDTAASKHAKKANKNKFLAEKLNSYKKYLEGSSSSSSSSDSESESSRKRRKRDHYTGQSKTSRSESHSRRDHHERRDRVRDQERDRGVRNSSPYKGGSRNRDYSNRDQRGIVKSTDTTYKSRGYERSSTSDGSSRNSQPSERKKPLEESEIEKKRREMMENAKWRENQLNKNVSKYREQDRKEEEKSSTKGDRDPDFIRKQLISAASTGSIEQRIKSNSYNIQRSKASMNQNFARR